MTPLPEITQFIVGQVGSSCAEPSWWQFSIIICLVAGSGVVVASSGIGFAAISSTIIGLLMAGASVDTISAALGAHLAVITGSIGIFNALISAIQRVLGC